MSRFMPPNAYFTNFETSFVVHWPNRRWIAVGSAAVSNRFLNALSKNISDTAAKIRRCSSLACSGTKIMKKDETGC